MQATIAQEFINTLYIFPPHYFVTEQMFKIIAGGSAMVSHVTNWKCNFPITIHVSWLGGWLVWS